MTIGVFVAINGDNTQNNNYKPVPYDRFDQ